MEQHKLPDTSAAFILLDGMALLKAPGIRKYLIIPILINIIVFTTLFWIGSIYAESMEQWLAGFLPEWLDFLAWLIWPVYIILGLLLLAYGFTTLANFIAAPFHGLLSEKVEAMYGLPSTESTMTTKGFIKSIPGAFGREIYKFWVNLKWMLLLLILLPFPMVNIFSVLIGSWLMALQYMDFPADNHDMSFKDFLKQLKKQRFKAFMHGLSIMLLSMIPLMNLLVVPAAVCASTLLWHRDYYQK